jgi:hypothetical protein
MIVSQNQFFAIDIGWRSRRSVVHSIKRKLNQAQLVPFSHSDVIAVAAIQHLIAALNTQLTRNGFYTAHRLSKAVQLHHRSMKTMLKTCHRRCSDAATLPCHCDCSNEGTSHNC